MTDGVILGVLAVIQEGAILEVIAAVLIDHEAEAAVGVRTAVIEAGAEG